MDSIYNELRWVVKVSRNHPDGSVYGYEPIAAFNTPRVAERYAAKCQTSNMDRQYEVIEMPEVERAEPRVIYQSWKDQHLNDAR